MELSKILLNPVRMRIIQFLMGHGETTAGEIIANMTDVPRTTIYRHLATLEEGKVIKVVQENKIRGTVEKVYRFEDPLVQDKTKQEDVINMALLGLISDFTRYYAKGTNDPVADMLMVRSIMLWMSDEEYQELLMKIGETLSEYLLNQPEENRKLRKFTAISSPISET